MFHQIERIMKIRKSVRYVRHQTAEYKRGGELNSFIRYLSDTRYLRLDKLILVRPATTSFISLSKRLWIYLKKTRKTDPVTNAQSVCMATVLPASAGSFRLDPMIVNAPMNIKFCSSTPAATTRDWRSRLLT